MLLLPVRGVVDVTWPLLKQSVAGQFFGGGACGCLDLSVDVRTSG